MSSLAVLPTQTSKSFEEASPCNGWSHKSCLVDTSLVWTPSSNETETFCAIPSTPPFVLRHLISCSRTTDASSSGSIPKPASLISSEILHSGRPAAFSAAQQKWREKRININLIKNKNKTQMVYMEAVAPSILPLRNRRAAFLT